MKYDMHRYCGHYDRVKVYALDPHNYKRSRAHTDLVLHREHFKNCAACSKKEKV